MIDVMVLYCADGYVSTSIAPLEIFHSAGLMWNMCVGRPAEPYFRITTASVDGAAVTCGAGVRVLPDKRLDAVEKTDLVFVPTAGMNVDILLAQNAAAIPWLQRLHARGRSLPASAPASRYCRAGLLDGRRATTHWAVAEIYRRRFPKVDWQTHLASPRTAACSAAAASMRRSTSPSTSSKLCGREVAIGCAKSARPADAPHLPDQFR
jgi:transcriptional regulator GlxA family with amidase domain